MVGYKCGIRNIHVVAAVAAVPFQCVLLIIFDDEGGICQIQLVIAAKIDGVSVSGVRSVHGHRNMVQRQGCFFAGTDRHPVPFRDIGCGADTLHHHIDSLKSQRRSPQGNAVIFKRDRGHRHTLRRPDGQILSEIQAIRNGIPQQFDDSAVRRSLDGPVQRLIRNLIDFGDSGFSLRQSCGGQQAEQHDARQQPCQ